MPSVCFKGCAAAVDALLVLGTAAALDVAAVAAVAVAAAVVVDDATAVGPAAAAHVSLKNCNGTPVTLKSFSLCSRIVAFTLMRPISTKSSTACTLESVSPSTSFSRKASAYLVMFRWGSSSATSATVSDSSARVPDVGICRAGSTTGNGRGTLSAVPAVTTSALTTCC